MGRESRRKNVGCESVLDVDVDVVMVDGDGDGA